MSPFAIRQAARLLRSGGLIAYPTEAVFGLGCDPLNAEAVLHLLHIKQRPASKGLILIAAHFEQLLPYVDGSKPELLAEALQSWPGPYTWIAPTRPDLPYWLGGGQPGVAVRVSAHPLVKALCEAFGGAIVSTSANRSGQQPARNELQVRLKLGEQIPVLHGATSGLLRPTPIRSALSGEILRS